MPDLPLKRQSQMDEVTREHKLRLLTIYKENLRELEIQAAHFGLTPPLGVVNGIKDARREIEAIVLELEVNAQEVSFDRLLLGIEDLQRLRRDEAKRVLKAHNETHWDDGMLALGVMVPFSVSMVAALGLNQLYRTYIRGVYIEDAYNLISVLIFVIILPVGLYYMVRLGKWVNKTKDDEFVKRVGYDPFEEKKKD